MDVNVLWLKLSAVATLADAQRLRGELLAADANKQSFGWATEVLHTAISTEAGELVNALREHLFDATTRCVY